MSSIVEPKLETSPAPKVEKPVHVPNERVVEFDMYNPVRPGEEYQAAWKELQAPGLPDLVWTPYNGGHWIATRGKLVKEMFTDYENFSSECPFVPKEAGEQYDFIPTSMNPPEQRPYRAVLNAAVGPHIIRTLDQAVTDLSISLIEGFRTKGECNFTEEYAQPFPMRIFLKLVNLPESDLPRLKYLSDQVTRPDGTMSLGEATQQLYDYLSPIIDERMANPGDDALSRVIHSKINGRALTKYEIERIGGLLLVGGLDTVVNFLSFAMQFLAQSPEHRRELIEHPERIPNATEELLRRFGVVADGRMVKNDIVVDGVQLKAGDMVLLPTMVFGLDEREHKCPMHVDFSRENTEHTTFGYGPHHCAGAHLARLEVQTTLREWLKRIPDFEIKPGATVTHQGGVVGAVQSLPLTWDPAKTRTVA